MKTVPVSRQKIKDLVSSKGITQKYLAGRIDITEQSFNRCLNRGYLKYENAKKLAELFGCNIESLSDNGESIEDAERLGALSFDFHLSEWTDILLESVFENWRILNNDENPPKKYNGSVAVNAFADDVMCLYMWHSMNGGHSLKDVLGEANHLFKHFDELKPIFADYYNLLGKYKHNTELYDTVISLETKDQDMRNEITREITRLNDDEIWRVYDYIKKMQSE